MDKEVEIDYQITNTDKLCGQGNINSLKGENGYWKSYIGADQTQLRCLFKNIYKNITCQIKLKNAEILEFTAYLDKNKQNTGMKTLKSKQLEAGNKIVYKHKNQNDQIDQIFIDLHSLKKKQVQLSYLHFFGTLIRNKPQKKSKKQNTQVFKQRVKQNNSKQNTKKIQIQLQKQQNQIKEQKIDIEEEQRKQAKERDNKKKANIDIYIPGNYDEEQLIDPEQLQLKRNYKTIGVTEKELKRISDVSEEWLQGQRKMQASFGVMVQHKLSVKISPKCFTGLKFCLANIYGEQKSKYVKIIKQLGGLIRQQPSQNCIVATNNPKGTTVGLAKIMVGTHIVKLAYLDQCYRLKNKVKFNKYYFASDQYFM